MRASLLALFVLALGCGEPPPPSTAAAPEIDRSPGERPSATVIELSLDGGDDAMERLIAQLPAGALRSGLPTRVSLLLDGLIETPSEIRTHVAPRSPLRVIMARVNGEI